MLLIFCIILICILYLILILIFYFGWKQIPQFEPKENEPSNTRISVVVACRNEQDHIPALISALEQQSYQNFELILVNDHSVDQTGNYIKVAQTSFPNIQLLDAVGFGKKNALKEGILSSKSDLIVTTDADCLPSERWLESIVNFQAQFPTDLIICPVRISENGTFFSRFQALEFVSLVASAAGSAGAGMPVLCNGANLAFKKNVWLKCQADLHEEEQSGDDMFLLESVKKQGGTICFLKSESAFVKTKPADNLVEFIKQRRRWASKSTTYTDWQLIFTACVVLAINLLAIILIVLSFYKSVYLFSLIALFTFKCLLDTGFLYSVRRFFKLKNTVVYSFLLSVVYPFYIVFVVVSALVLKPVKWK